MTTTPVRSLGGTLHSYTRPHNRRPRRIRIPILRLTHDRAGRERALLPIIALSSASTLTLLALPARSPTTSFLHVIIIIINNTIIIIIHNSEV